MSAAEDSIREEVRLPAPKTWEYGVPDIENDLSELELILHSWYRKRESDSLDLQRLRTCEFLAAGKIIRYLIEKARSKGKVVRLTSGHSDITQYGFSVGDKRASVDSTQLLAPGSVIDLERVRRVTIDHSDQPTPGDLYPSPETCVGDRFFIPLSSVARAIYEGGDLVLAETAPTPNA